MAEFFKKIGKGISDTSKNVKESVENSRRKSDLRRQITSANNKIEQIKLSMGEMLYNAYLNDVAPDDCTELCRQIDELKVAEKKYKAAILAIDGIKKCDACGREINSSSVFCSHCGARQFKYEEPDENDASTEQPETDERSYVDVSNH